jgi:hypothetical protein
MSKAKKSTVEVQGTAITVLNQAGDEYISLTDIAKHKEPDRSDHVKDGRLVSFQADRP